MKGTLQVVRRRGLHAAAVAAAARAKRASSLAAQVSMTYHQKMSFEHGRGGFSSDEDPSHLPPPSSSIIFHTTSHSSIATPPPPQTEEPQEYLYHLHKQNTCIRATRISPPSQEAMGRVDRETQDSPTYGGGQAAISKGGNIDERWEATSERERDNQGWGAQIREREGEHCNSNSHARV